MGCLSFCSSVRLSSIIWFPLNILRTKWHILTKFYIWIYINKIRLGIVTFHILHICTRVMALDLCQNFVSAQYLENQLIEFHQILYMDSYWQDLAWDCFTSFCTRLYQSYGPWFTTKFPFRSISWKPFDRISPNFLYEFILTRSTLGLLHVIFHIFVPELWPLIYAKIWFQLNILRTNLQNSPNFMSAFILTRTRWELLPVIFCLFESWPVSEFCEHDHKVIIL